MAFDDRLKLLELYGVQVYGYPSKKVKYYYYPIL